MLGISELNIRDIETIGDNGTITFPVWQLMKMEEKGTLTFDNEVQRGLVWKVEQKSKLIDSILRGVKIPPICVNQKKKSVDNGKKDVNWYDVLDGKQRCRAVFDYVNNKYALDSLEPFACVIDQDDETVMNIDVTGYYYDALPEYFKEKIRSFSMSLTYYIGADQDDIDEIFIRINNGKPLTAIEKTRVMVKSKDKLRQLADHPVFQRILTKSAFNSKTNEDIIMKGFITLYDDDPCTDNSSVAPYFEMNEMDDKSVKNMMGIMDVADSVLESIGSRKEDEYKKTYKTLKKKTHFISMMSVIKDATKWGAIDLDLLVDFFINFFGAENADPSISVTYNGTTQSGAGHKEQVVRRTETIADAYNTFRYEWMKEMEKEMEKKEAEEEEWDSDSESEVEEDPEEKGGETDETETEVMESEEIV